MSRYISDYPHALLDLADDAASNAAKHPSEGARQTWDQVARVIKEAADKVRAIVDNRN